MGDVMFNAYICDECRKKALKGEPIEVYLKEDGYYLVCKHMV